MASIIRKVARPVSQNARSFTSVLDDAAIKSHALEQVHTWRRFSLFSAPVVVLFGVWKLSAEHGHHSAEPPQYEYLHIRSKPFPWGPLGLFEQPRKHHDDEDDE